MKLMSNAGAKNMEPYPQDMLSEMKGMSLFASWATWTVSFQRPEKRSAPNPASWRPGPFFHAA